MEPLAKESKGHCPTICNCGLADYRDLLDLQHRLRDERQRGEIPDTVLIIEHKPVITLGARQSANKLLVSRDELAQKQIDVVEIRRGGGATAHNPGQLVFYPILNLQDLKLGINEYIRELEAIGIELLEQLGVKSQRRKGFPGLWVVRQDSPQVGEKKIASIGVRVSKSVTCHGMAINIQNDLSIFDYIIPCGLENVRMTSVFNETGKKCSMQEAKDHLSRLLVRHFGPEIRKCERRLPAWLNRPLPAGGTYNHTDSILSSLGLETICGSANCPNRGECWSRGTATVLILGNVCTRNCKFCSVAKGRPAPPDPTEPQRVAEMAKQMGLKYLVITSVDRDDLPDGGAGQFRDCIQEVRRQCPDVKFEILTPDFRDCQNEAIDILATEILSHRDISHRGHREHRDFVFAHNVETVPSLYSKARQGGNYQRSLKLLKLAKKSFAGVPIKSSIMLGLGESDDEVEQVLKDLRDVGCDRLTIGQYLKPSKESLEVVEYIRPAKFDWWRQKAVQLGFSWVMSSPFARSSYFAEQQNA